MIDYRKILRLSAEGRGQREIERETLHSRHTISDALTAAQAAGISWPLDDDVTNEMIQEILFPGKYAYASPYTIPDFQWIHRELARNGVTLTLLWNEYCVKVRNDGGVPYMYTQFCDKYRHWARVTKATMRISHKPGDAMQVDWAGDPLYITERETGEEWPAYVFVAVLPCSWNTYAEPCNDMKSENWLLCHVHAYEYFGGVTRLLIPDNCKTATTSNTRYETILNKSYQEMADYYGTAIVPARVKKPDDKAAVEGSVKFVSTWITAALRDRKFFSLEEAKEAVREKLDELNSKPFKKRVGCRKSAYEEEEKAFMRPLPPKPFEPAIWLNPKVSTDYLVSDGKNKYSVPFDLIGENVDVRIAKNVIEVYFKGTRVATHVRLQKAERDPVVKPEHMPEAHRRYLQEYNAEEFESWGKSVGPKTSEVVHYFLTSGREVEQGYKSCASLKKLEKSYSAKRLEYACSRVLTLSPVPTIRNINILIKSNPEKEPEKPAPARDGKSHGFVRGAAYYSKGGQHNE